jgi:hypothetical protein
MIFMVEIAVDTSLVAAIGEVDLHAQGNSQLEGSGADFINQATHVVSSCKRG